MKHSKIDSSVALFLIVILSMAILGWILYVEQGAFTETVQVGSEGVRKAQEVKRLLEEQSSQGQL